LLNKQAGILANLFFAFCLVGCLPTLHIDGEFTVVHHVVHSVDDKGDRKGKDVTVHELKVMGLVGERYDGYLGAVVPDVDDKVRNVIDTVNAQRRQKYESITAQVAGTSLADIEKQAGRAMMKRERNGFFVMAEADKQWRKK